MVVKFFEAIREAISQSMIKNHRVYLLGLGVPDPKGIFGTTLGLKKKFGKDRVFDTPTSENGITGIALGTSLGGLRPILTHQRVEFALLSIDQIVNQAAKWFYMNDGQMSVPLVIRLIVGRGWGQGPQHAQSLESWFAHIPGLKVVSPSNAYDAKGLLISSIEDNNPVIFYENRWLHNTIGHVPKKMYRIPIGKCNIISKGNSLTIVSHSYMIIECLKCVKFFKQNKINIELIDLRTIRPLDTKTILQSVKKTKKLLVVDTDWVNFSVSSEIITLVTENLFNIMTVAPQRIGLEDVPSPSSASLAKFFYPTSFDIGKKIIEIIGKKVDISKLKLNKNSKSDIPDKSFNGPF